MIGLFNNIFGPAFKKELLDLYKSGALLLDVRTQEEFDSESVEDSLHIPLDLLIDNLAVIPKDVPIIVVCQSGIRSRTAINILQEYGFSDLHNGISWFYFK